jgi:hypothetical protein
LPESEIERVQKNHAAYLEKVKEVDAMTQKLAKDTKMPPLTPVLNTKQHTFKKRRK